MPPVLNSFSLRNNTVSVGDTLYFDYDISDASGLRSVIFNFTSPTGISLYASDYDDDGVAEYLITEDTPAGCLLYTSPSPRDGLLSRMPSSA